MLKVRLLIFLTTIAVVLGFTTVIFMYAQGYRVNPNTLEVSPNGLLVIKSYPDSSQVYINGELKTATNATVPLPPGTYDVSVQKEGYHNWSKRLDIDKEVVTEATAHLFKIAPSLSAITFSGVENPVPSSDFSKLLYAVPATVGGNGSSGLWVLESVNLPLGFSRDPKRITDADTVNSTWLWSPDGREVLLSSAKGIYLLDAGTFTPQSTLVNVGTRKEQILIKWQEEKSKKLNAQMKKIPPEVQDILNRKASQVMFSQDEDMVMYTASASATIPNDLITKLPGSSTQKQEREVKANSTYVYDIVEDRNFMITDRVVQLHGWSDYSSTAPIKSKNGLSWYFSTRHVIIAEEGRITIMDYDGTNRQVIYTGSYVAPYAYSTTSLDRLLILTSLGANTQQSNLYSLSIK